MKPLVPALAALLLAFVAQDDASDAEKYPMPKIGEPAPSLRLNDHTGRAIEVGGESENWRVLAFFPKAMTPGWTVEVCSLRDAAEELEELGVEVFGLSLDDVQDLAQFAEAQYLPFMLLSDPDGSVARRYGVLPEKARWTNRITFIIDDAGVLRAIDTKVNVEQHGTDVAARVRELQGE